MKKAIFFDLYGTLIDIRTDEDDPWVYSVLSQYLSYHQINAPPDALRDAYSTGIEQHLKKTEELYPEVDVYEVFCEIMHKYGQRRYPKSTVIDTVMLFRSLTRRRFGVFPFVYETLAHLGERYKMALISDAQWVFTEPEMAMLGLDRYFRVRILSSRYGFKKPDARLFDIAMARLKVGPEDSIYIGDNPRKDLVGAKEAGMKCILFRWENFKHNDLSPDSCFSDYPMLEEILYELL